MIEWITYSPVKLITERCSKKKKNRSRASHEQPAWKCKIKKEIEALKGELPILEDLSKGINVKTKTGWKVQRK